MIYSSNLTAIKNTAKALLVSLIFSSTIANAQMPTISSGVEMGLGLATIPFDIAAHRYDFTDQKKTAAFLHLTTDTISILNKLFFFGNNIKNQGMNGFTGFQKDCMVNTIWLARDLTRLYQHAKAYQTSENAVQVVQEEITVQNDEDFLPIVDITIPDDELFLSFDGNDVPAAIEQLKPEEISQLAYLCQVFVIPILRGLTAGALAWAQDESSGDLNSQHGRALITSAHSLVRLSQEYGELDAESSYKKMLVGAALIANTVWLYKEWQNYNEYKSRQNAHRAFLARQHRAQERQQRRIQNRLDQIRGIPQQAGAGALGSCQGICAEDNIQLIRLPCGQTTLCRNCFITNIETNLEGGVTVCCPGHQGIPTPQDQNPNPVLCRHRLIGVHNNDRRAEIEDEGPAYQLTDVNVRDIVGQDHELLRQFVTTKNPIQLLNDLPYCRRCFLQHDRSTTCEDERRFASQEDIDYAAEMIRSGSALCPGANCGKPIMRSQGCNHITCTQCRHQFCIVCLGDWNRGNGPCMSYECGRGGRRL